MSETTERVFSSLSGLEGASDRTGNGRAERTDLDLVRCCILDPTTSAGPPAAESQPDPKPALGQAA